MGRGFGMRKGGEERRGENKIGGVDEKGGKKERRDDKGGGGEERRKRGACSFDRGRWCGQPCLYNYKHVMLALCMALK